MSHSCRVCRWIGLKAEIYPACFFSFSFSERVKRPRFCKPGRAACNFNAWDKNDTDFDATPEVDIKNRRLQSKVPGALLSMGLCSGNVHAYLNKCQRWALRHAECFAAREQRIAEKYPCRIRLWELRCCARRHAVFWRAIPEEQKS